MPDSTETFPLPPEAESETSASSEQTVHLDVGEAPSSSARTARHPILPDGRPIPWRVRHREKIYVGEWILIGAFLALTGYFIWAWFFTLPDVPAVPPPVEAPTRAGFVRALGMLPPIPPQPEWKIAAKPGRWTMIVIHHTATPGGSGDSIDRFHRENNKWQNGLGYHFLIGNGNGMADGEVHVGRRWTEQLDGAHVKMAGNANANAYAVGISLVGNFQDSLPTPRQLASLRGLLAFLMEEYGIPPSRVAGHKDVSAKSTKCPGDWFFVEEAVRASANR